MAWEKALAVCSRAAASTRLREQRRGKGQEQTFSDVPGGAVGRNPPAEAGARARSAVREDPTRPGATEVRVSPLPKPVRPEPGLCNQTRRQGEKPGSRSRVVPARHGHGPGNEDPARPKTINKSQKKEQVFRTRAGLWTRKGGPHAPSTRDRGGCVSPASERKTPQRVQTPQSSAFH